MLIDFVAHNNDRIEQMLIELVAHNNDTIYVIKSEKVPIPYNIYILIETHLLLSRTHICLLLCHLETLSNFIHLHFHP